MSTPSEPKTQTTSAAGSGLTKLYMILGIVAVVGVGVACAVAINRWLCKLDRAPD